MWLCETCYDPRLYRPFSTNPHRVVCLECKQRKRCFSGRTPQRPVRLGSLFSGIAGLELGLEWAFQAKGIPVETVFQVEIDPYCRRVLQRHYPETERYSDVKTFDGTRYRGTPPAGIDVLCGGFPCQDVSSAGKRVGLDGDRSGLWSEFDRLIGEIEPRWIVVENVASGAAMWVDRVLSDMGRRGYETLPIPLEARHVGALHRRRRVFVLGWLTDAHQRPEREQPGYAEVAGSPGASGAAGGLRGASHADGAALRDGAERRSWGRPGGVRDTREPESLFPSWRSPEPNVVRVVHGISGGVDFRTRTHDGKRRHALGNSVVPQCTEVVGHVMIELERRLHGLP